MVLKVRTMVLGVMVLLAGGSFGPPVVSSQPQPPINFNIIDLGTLGGFSSVALPINGKAQVVGNADTGPTPVGVRADRLEDALAGYLSRAEVLYADPDYMCRAAIPCVFPWTGMPQRPVHERGIFCAWGRMIREVLPCSKTV